MPARNSPPPAAIVLGVLVVAAVAVVVMNRAAKPERREPIAPFQPPPSDFVIDHPRLQPLDQAVILENSGRPDEAAALIRRVLDRDPDNVEALFALRRVLPADKKGELADRLGKCARPEAHFGDLVDDAREADDAAARAALFDGLKKARPQDPRWGCDEIELLVRDKKYADATARFGELVKGATSPPVQARYVVVFLHEMRLAGRAAEAYAATPDAHLPTALQMLAQRFENALLEGNTFTSKSAAKGELRAIVAAHRKRAPDDPMVRYYDGVLLQADGEFEKAAREYAEGMGKWPAPPPPTQDLADYPQPGDWKWAYEMFRTRRVQCLYALGRALAAYADVGPPEYTFRQLAFEFVKDKKADPLAELIAAHAKRFPDAAELPFWNGEVQFLRGEYAKAAESFAAFEKRPSNLVTERWRLPERLARARLRAGDAAGAARVVVEASSDRIPVALRTAVLAAQGDHPAVAANLEAETQRGGAVVTLYTDDDFAREIAAARYAELRAKYPDPRRK